MARVRDVASKAKIDIRICVYCVIAAIIAKNVEIKKMNCTKIARL